LALVTGASSGLGAEFALQLARLGHDLLLTGRDPERLAATAARAAACGAEVATLARDLDTPAGVADLVAWAGSRPLEVLVNNAGFGCSGPFAQADPESLAAMIQLNAAALVLLTRAVLPAMLARGRGRILNLASTASFQPCPVMAVYGATKAFVLSFSEAVAEEVAGSGVTVTALCPGPTDTRFAARAEMAGSPLFRRAMAPAGVARIGLRAMRDGRRLRVAGMANRVQAFSVRFVPRPWVVKVAHHLMRKAE
jgi:hypothetical protein